MKIALLASVAALSLTLSACVIQGTSPSDSTSRNTNAAPSSRTSNGSESAAKQACLAAVSRETNNRDVEVISSEFSQAGTLVKVGVGEQRAPWKCIAYSDGSTADIQFLGTEGHSVSTPAAGNINDLANFEGARAGQAEGGLQNLGYTLARTQGLTAYWYNASRNACAKIVTSEGRYESVTQAALSECNR